MIDSRLYWIWLQQALEPGGNYAHEALLRFERPEQVYAADEKALFGLFSAAKRQRLLDKDLAVAEQILKQTLAAGDWVLTPDDPYYPALLRGIYEPPLLLYGRGEMSPFDRLPVIGMVGTREYSEYGAYAAASLATGLAAGGAVIVSGGARGIDAACHEAAMNAGGVTVAIQACGLDVNYPRKNEAMRRRIIETGGAILTEYPPGTPPNAHQFPVRNRLISGMTLGVCVVEAPEKSGALITASVAREQGRDVFAVPGDILSQRSEGCNALIKQGARLVSTAAEILEEYRFRFGEAVQPEQAAAAQKRFEAKHPYTKAVEEPPAAIPTPAKKAHRQPPPPAATPCFEAAPEGVSEPAKALFAALSREAKHAEQLAEETGLSMAKALAALTELEMFGAAEKRAGGGYLLKCR